MQKHLFILLSTLVFFTTGCEQKNPAQADAATTAIKAVPPKVEQSLEQDKALVKTDKTTPAKIENSEKKAPIAVKETTEQSLADISKHGREVTKSQESKTRTRAQIAEDEMLKDLEKFK